jgi:hypothetical protein
MSLEVQNNDFGARKKKRKISQFYNQNNHISPKSFLCEKLTKFVEKKSLTD